MDFDFSEEQRLLKDSVDRLISDQYGFEQRRKYIAEPDGWSSALWSQYAELGLLGLPFEEALGGFGGGAAEMMIVMEAFGRGLILEPFFATVVLGGGLLKRAASAEQRAELIPLVAQGKLKLALAHIERHSRWNLADVTTTARQQNGNWVLDGAKGVVLHGDCADKLLVTARVSGAQRDRAGIGLFLVDANGQGVARRGYPTQDGLRAAEVTLSGARAEAVLGEPGGALPMVEQVVDEATAALCAEAVGVMVSMQEITLDYLKTRQQFGRPDRQLPGVAVPGRGHADGGRAGAQHGAVRDRHGDRGGRPGKAAFAVGGQGADRPLRQACRAGGDPAARRHRHDDGVPGRALLQAHDHDRPNVRRRRPSPDGPGANGRAVRGGEGGGVGSNRGDTSMKTFGTAAWEGGIKDGKGAISTNSGAMEKYPYGFASRFEGKPGTNPEELIGAAHAGCFTMALSLILGEAQLTAEHMETKAEVTLDKVADGFAITAVHLTLNAKIPGATQAKLEELAAKAKAGCPVSKLLNTEITLEATLTA